jgi:hypothetical protein
MASANDVTEATPSALTGGNAFTVTWDSSGATATAVPTPATTAIAPGAGVPHGAARLLITTGSPAGTPPSTRPRIAVVSRCPAIMSASTL